VPHERLPLVSHQPQGDLTGLSEEALGAHGPHGVDHVLGQPEGNHLGHVERLPLVEREGRAGNRKKGYGKTISLNFK